MLCSSCSHGVVCFINIHLNSLVSMLSIYVCSHFHLSCAAATFGLSNGQLYPVSNIRGFACLSARAKAELSKTMQQIFDLVHVVP